MILDVLAAAGHPTNGILVDLGERHVLMQTTQFALTGLTPEKLGQSSYISKMIIAESVGLFDAALNYLWDETVQELRKRVVNFDLQYFYEVAEKSDHMRHGPDHPNTRAARPNSTTGSAFIPPRLTTNGPAAGRFRSSGRNRMPRASLVMRFKPANPSTHPRR
jgi:hypothetical protein